MTLSAEMLDFFICVFPVCYSDTSSIFLLSLPLCLNLTTVLICLSVSQSVGFQWKIERSGIRNRLSFEVRNYESFGLSCLAAKKNEKVNMTF